MPPAREIIFWVSGRTPQSATGLVLGLSVLLHDCGQSFSATARGQGIPAEEKVVPGEGGDVLTWPQEKRHKNATFGGMGKSVKSERKGAKNSKMQKKT